MSAIQRFMRLESAGGILLVLATILAIIAENSAFKPIYDALLSTPFEIRLGGLELAKPLLLWINDALMAIFFFLVGLELKREVLAGQLSSPDQLVLPSVAALAGIAFPALIYVAFNAGDPIAMKGWAIPAATDIAFALGVIALIGKRVPPALKLLLLALAIIDDIGAIVIIALFYSGDMSAQMLWFAAGAVIVLSLLNIRNVTSFTPYLIVGTILWIAVLKSGVHATLAGIVLAMFIPLRKAEGEQRSLLGRLEHDLHPAVAFFILPLFAFANAGISLADITWQQLMHPVPLGIAAGLIAGKQLGIFGAIWLSVKLGIARLPLGVSWMHIYGLSVLCGIGFTMSLFISSLAFEQGGAALFMNDRLGVIVGSLISAVAGYIVLRFIARPVGAAEQT